MLTRDGERMIEVLLLAGALTAAVVLDLDGTTHRDDIAGTSASAPSAEIPGSAMVTPAATPASRAEPVAVEPLRALDTTVRRAISELAEIDSVRRC